jgi:hypothetical protein
MDLLRATGIAGIPLLLLSLVIGALILRAVVRQSRGGNVDLFALLFWGFAAAVLGFLAQCAGVHQALTVISTASEISPQIVARGFAQSFLPTLWGGGLLLLAGLAWVLLRLWRRRLPLRPALR